MTTYDLTQKTNASTGQRIVPSHNEIRLQNLEDKVTSQSERLEHIVKYSMSYQKRNQLLEIIQEYKSDNTALKEQIKDLKKQLDDAESRIKRLLIRFEQFEYDSKDEK